MDRNRSGNGRVSSSSQMQLQQRQRRQSTNDIGGRSDDRDRGAEGGGGGGGGEQKHRRSKSPMHKYVQRRTRSNIYEGSGNHPPSSSSHRAHPSGGGGGGGGVSSSSCRQSQSTRVRGQHHHHPSDGDRSKRTDHDRDRRRTTGGERMYQSRKNSSSATKPSTSSTQEHTRSSSGRPHHHHNHNHHPQEQHHSSSAAGRQSSSHQPSSTSRHRSQQRGGASSAPWAATSDVAKTKLRSRSRLREEHLPDNDDDDDRHDNGVDIGSRSNRNESSKRPNERVRSRSSIRPNSNGNVGKSSSSRGQMDHSIKSATDVRNSGNSRTNMPKRMSKSLLQADEDLVQLRDSNHSQHSTHPDKNKSSSTSKRNSKSTSFAKYDDDIINDSNHSSQQQQQQSKRTSRDESSSHSMLRDSDHSNSHSQSRRKSTDVSASHGNREDDLLQNDSNHSLPRSRPSQASHHETTDKTQSTRRASKSILLNGNLSQDARDKHQPRGMSRSMSHASGDDLTQMQKSPEDDKKQPRRRSKSMNLSFSGIDDNILLLGYGGIEDDEQKSSNEDRKQPRRRSPSPQRASEDDSRRPRRARPEDDTKQPRRMSKSMFHDDNILLPGGEDSGNEGNEEDALKPRRRRSKSMLIKVDDSDQEDDLDMINHTWHGIPKQDQEDDDASAIIMEQTPLRDNSRSRNNDRPRSNRSCSLDSAKDHMSRSTSRPRKLTDEDLTRLFQSEEEEGGGDQPVSNAPERIISRHVSESSAMGLQWSDSVYSAEDKPDHQSVSRRTSMSSENHNSCQDFTQKEDSDGGGLRGSTQRKSDPSLRKSDTSGGSKDSSSRDQSGRSHDLGVSTNPPSAPTRGYKPKRVSTQPPHNKSSLKNKANERLSNCYEDSDEDEKEGGGAGLLWMLSTDSLDETSHNFVDDGHALEDDESEVSKNSLNKSERKSEKKNASGERRNHSVKEIGVPNVPVLDDGDSVNTGNTGRSKSSKRKNKDSNANSGVTESTADDADSATINSKASSINGPPEYASNDGERNNKKKKDKRERKRHGLYVSPLMMCTLCFCYSVSLCLIGALGFGVHMFMFADKEDDSAPWYKRDKGDVNTESQSEDEILQELNMELSPSFRPSSNENFIESELPRDAEAANTLSPSISSDPSNSPTDSLSNTPSSMPSTPLPTNFPSSSSSLSPSLSIQPSRSLPPSLGPTKDLTMEPSTSRSPSLDPTNEASMQPSSAPSYSPSLSPSRLSSMQPSSAPSYSPSTSPTEQPKCPEQLLKSVFLDNDELLQMKYEIVFYRETMNDLGGLLCVSLEYTGTAGWIGLAVSEATRNPQFGRKEAIVGIPGVRSSMAVATQESGASLGQQLSGLEGGPIFVNPGKYEIPAGGIDEGFTGPSLRLLRDYDQQTLRDASVFATNAYLDPNDLVSDFMTTNMSFEKYLREPNEIEINPYESTLLLYAVAPMNKGGEYDGNPEWRYKYVKFLDSSTEVLKAGPVRKRIRKHEVNR